MDTGILLIREEDCFRVLFGHHRLAAILQRKNELFVDVKGEPGRARVFRSPSGLLVTKDSRNLPLRFSIHRNCCKARVPRRFRHSHTGA